MVTKKNEYLVVRREADSYNRIDWEDFEDCVRGYRNGGFELQGGICITETSVRCIVAQALAVPTFKTSCVTGPR